MSCHMSLLCQSNIVLFTSQNLKLTPRTGRVSTVCSFQTRPKALKPSWRNALSVKKADLCWSCPTWSYRLKIGKDGCPASPFQKPLKIKAAFTNVKLYLMNEICPKKHWSIYIVTFLEGVFVAKNHGRWVGALRILMFLHCWMKSSIHHQAPKTLQFQSPASNDSNEWPALTSRYFDVVPAVFTPERLS